MLCMAMVGKNALRLAAAVAESARDPSQTRESLNRKVEEYLDRRDPQRMADLLIKTGLIDLGTRKKIGTTRAVEPDCHFRGPQGMATGGWQCTFRSLFAELGPVLSYPDFVDPLHEALRQSGVMYCTDGTRKFKLNALLQEEVLCTCCSFLGMDGGVALLSIEAFPTKLHTRHS